MRRRDGAPAMASRRVRGEDKGRAAAQLPTKEKATALQSALILARGLTVGRALLQAARSGSESRRGNHRNQAGPELTAISPAPSNHHLGIGPRKQMIADANIAVFPCVFQRGPGLSPNADWARHEHPFFRQANSHRRRSH